jgi:hypothetical protein
MLVVDSLSSTVRTSSVWPWGQYDSQTTQNVDNTRMCHVQGIHNLATNSSVPDAANGFIYSSNRRDAPELLPASARTDQPIKNTAALETRARLWR